jgi:anti-anti-sigma factor
MDEEGWKVHKDGDPETIPVTDEGVMSLHIKSEQAGDVAVLQCAGRIVRGEALQLLKDAVTSLRQPRVIVLDLSAVEMLDGGGLGMLVFWHCWTRDNGIQLKLVNPSNFVREMLEQTGLTSFLHVSSLDEAVEVLCNFHSSNENVNRAVA